jgi:hypothetical protein
MNSNRKFVIILELLVITFLIMSVVPVCGLSDSSADISAYPSIANPDDEITVTYSGAPGFELDRIAMYKVGDPNEEEYEGAGFYLESEKSGTLIFTAPDEPGDYEFRLFESVEFSDIARSNIVTVQEGTTVSTPTPTPTPAITLTPTTTPATTQPTTPPVTPPELSGKGDCNGDGKITSVDALCALQMAVAKRAEDLVMDINGDGSVTSLDARKILRIAVGLEEL